MKVNENVKRVIIRNIETGEEMRIDDIKKIEPKDLFVSENFISLHDALQESCVTWEKLHDDLQEYCATCEKKEEHLSEEKKHCKCYMRKQQIERELNVIRFDRNRKKREKRRMKQNGNKKH